MCYIGHHHFLVNDHKYRCSKKAFNEEIEMRLLENYYLGLIRSNEGLNITFEKHPSPKEKKKGT